MQAPLDAKEIDRRRIEFIKNIIGCHEIGTILDFNPVSCTATIQIMRKEIDDIDAFDLTYTDISPLLEVPVFILGGASGGLEYPVSIGDECILLFCDRDITTYITTKTIAGAPTYRSHDKRDAIALIAKISPPDYNNNQTKIFYKDIESGNENSIILNKDGGNFNFPFIFQQNVTINGNLEVGGQGNFKGGTLKIGGSTLEDKSGKLTLNGKEIVVVGAPTSDGAVIQQSGQ